MKSKNLLVFFLAIASVLFLVSTVVSASTSNAANIYSVEIDNAAALGASTSVIAGDTIKIDVYFTSDVDASDVRMKAELEGDKINVDAVTTSFDIEDGNNYRKTLTLKVPYELKDQVSDDLTLNIKIWNGDYRSDAEVDLRVQRPSYETSVMSINVAQNADAGEMVPVDVVLKNTGYNNLDDLYVTLSIPELGIQRTSYFGDLIAVECDDDFTNTENYGVNISRKCNEDDQDTVSGRFYVQIPYDAKAGVYTVQVEAKNSDTTTDAVQQIAVNNDFSSDVIATTVSKTFDLSDSADYTLLVVNPTNKLKVYRVVPESSADLSVTTSDSVVAIPAGTSRTVTLTAKAASAGEYKFNVNVFSGEDLVDTVTMTANATGSSLADPVVVLAIIMIIVFVVLLIVLIVLLGKKPAEKQEDFGESYY